MHCSKVFAVLALAVSVTVWSGCRSSGCMKGPERTIQVPLDLPDPANVSESIEFFMKRFSHGDLNEAGEALREDVTWYGFGSTRPPIRGRENVMKRLEVIKGACSDAAMAPAKVLATGDAVIVRYTLRGTHDGWLSGVKGKGAKVGAEGLAFYRFDDLSIYEIGDYFNTNTLLVQAGLLPGDGVTVPVLPPEYETIRSGPVPPTQWRDRIEAAYEALNRDDDGPFVQMLDPAVVHRDHLADSETRGPEEVTRSIKGFRGAFTDVRFQILGLHQVEQYVAVRVTWTGTYAGGQGRPWAVNKRPACHRADLFLIRDDRVVQVQSFGNPVELGLHLDFERF